MKLFYDLKSHLKPFDLKKIKDLKNNHPFQRIMVMTNKLYRNYQMGGGGGNYENGEENDHYVVPLTNDILQDIDHFKMLDDYYRYGLAFDNSDFYPDNILCIKDSHSVNKSDTIPFMVDEFYLLETLIKNDVKIINPNVCDTGENTLSDIEKWKRKVINKQSNRKTKLRLLNPNIYRSLITFYIFSNFKSRNNNKFNYDITDDGVMKIYRQVKQYNYEDIKKIRR